MPSARSIIAFALKFLVIYGALALSWPLCRPAYTVILRESNKVMFEMVGAGDHMRMRATMSPDLRNDTLYFVHNPNGQWVEFALSSWLIGFQPMSLFIGLVVATPVNMWRRVFALFVGLVILYAFVFARLSMFAILWPFILPGTFWTKALQWSVLGFVYGLALSCFIPVLIWIAVTIRWEDARQFFASTPKSAELASEGHVQPYRT